MFRVIRLPPVPRETFERDMLSTLRVHFLRAASSARKRRSTRGLGRPYSRYKNKNKTRVLFLFLKFLGPNGRILLTKHNARFAIHKTEALFCNSKSVQTGLHLTSDLLVGAFKSSRQRDDHRIIRSLSHRGKESFTIPCQTNQIARPNSKLVHGQQAATTTGSIHHVTNHPQPCWCALLLCSVL